MIFDCYFFIFFFKQKKINNFLQSLRNKLIEVNTAPDPTNILWQNLDISKP